MRIDVPDPEAIHALGVRLGENLRAGDLVILTGPLGAGKTTLTRGIGEGLGVRGPVQSPTFVIARTHPSLVGGAPLVHVDAYRLSDAMEVEDLDIDFEGSVVVAEWGAGMVEPGDSWLEIVIERPTGSDAAVPSVGESTRGVREHTPGEPPSVCSDPQRVLSRGTARPEAYDDAVDGDDAEPRVVTVTGHGPRWTAAGSRPEEVLA